MKKQKKSIVYLGLGITLITMDLLGTNIGFALPIGIILMIEGIDKL